MSDAGKKMVSFAVAAVCGGGVAFLATRHETFPTAARYEAPPGQAERVSLTEDGRTRKLSQTSSNEPGTSTLKTAATAPDAVVVNTIAPPAHKRHEEMLKLLRSVRHSSPARSLSSEKEAHQRLRKALDDLLLHLRKSESARAIITRRDTEGIISTLAKITPPTTGEINNLKKMLVRLQADLPPQQLLQFQNQSLLMLRQFIFDPNKVLVVFITQQFPGAASSRGNFHSHLTTRPEEYWHHHNGEPIGVPQGESNFEGGPVYTPLSADFRYYHLASVP